MRRWWPYIVLILAWNGLSEAAKPTFENQTPRGFSPQDSTVQEDFVVGDQVSVHVDLNQAATYEYPVIGHFHAVEKSDQIGTTATDGMQVDIVMVDMLPDATGESFPTIHMAWIEETTSIPRASFYFSNGTTPVYQVMYASSDDGGATFTTPVEASAGVTYYPLTTSVSGEGTFSTLDLEVDSSGNPRVVYAFVSTADETRKKNVYFAYSQDGGGTWETPVQVNDTQTVGATETLSCAFPRMAIDDRDNIFITYVRGASSGSDLDDVMLAKVNRFASPFSILPVGGTAPVQTGGVRLTDDGTRQTGPDIAVGDGDALHLIYFDDATDRIEHKRVATDTSWVDGSSSGWDSDVAGGLVADFVDEVNNGLETVAAFYFPTIVVDRNRLPDRVYAVFKYGDNTPVEGIYFNQYDDDGTIGPVVSWSTASSVWSTTAPSPLFADGANNYNIELDWQITERVAAIVDQRLDEQGDLHIAFTAGYSTGGEHDIYYARYNGSSWTLPEKVADDDSDGAGEQDGIDNADVFLLSPALTRHPDADNIYLGFVGGAGEGFGLGGVTDVDHHAYFKVLGRSITWEDESVPVGGYRYTLSYTPINPQDLSRAVDSSLDSNNVVYVHVADPTNGTGLGARADSSDGFLAGDWETVGTTLADDDKYFEGLVNEDATSTNEWGDDDDKINLLVKLNVLGSDSATNVQMVTNSTASDAGTGQGARTVRVGDDPTGTFVAAGTFFFLGADIDIVAANTGPTVSIAQPDGVDDVANTEYAVQYSAEDGDDDLSGSLQVALYAYPTDALRTVQDVRIFGTLIVDENDVSSNNPDGTDDLTEGANQTYTWDDPPAALKTSALFASILRMSSGDYYIYIVADDGKNSPVFAVSSGPVTIRHSPIVQQIDPIVAETVDTGVRTGLMANPYDLDFRVVDYDSEARVQLFYSSVNGLSSVSVIGTYPGLRFALGKSLSGRRAIPITHSDTLTSIHTEFSWDVTDLVCALGTCGAGDSTMVTEGAYFIYAVASDTDTVYNAVGQSQVPLIVKHSPSFVFYEPARDTQRRIDSGSQSIYAIQWQKGPGDQDLDDDATIALYFTTDDPAVTDHSTDAGASSSSLTDDGDTKLIVNNLSEDGDGADDMYVWNLRTPPNEVPEDGQQVWLYAVIDDGANTSVVRGGSLIIVHNPYILLKTRMPQISQGDIVRLAWDDYMVDDDSGTDNAYIRLYASRTAGHATLESLEENLVGVGGSQDSYIINSSNGQVDGTITAIREDGSDAFSWDTRTSGLELPVGTYSVYAGISGDATFSDNTAGRVSAASNQLIVGGGAGAIPHLSLSPSRVQAAVGEMLTFEVWAQSADQAATSLSIVVDLGTNLLSVVNPSSPCTDLGEIFIGGTVVENTSSGTEVRFTKTRSGGEIIGSSLDQLRLASFQVVVESGFSGQQIVEFDDEETAMSIAGASMPMKAGSGLSMQSAKVQAVPPGRILATVLLEGRSPPIGNADHATLLDVHLRLPGSTVDIDDSGFRKANDDDILTTPDTVEVQTSSAGALILDSVPAGRYVLAVKATSHLSGRTDTLVVRNGESLTISSAEGFFASDVRGDPSFLLSKSGNELKAGDATEDNEVDEDDVNTIDAAWGSDAGAPNFAQADLNDDGRVGVEDLTVTTSNISNSEGFGAPPVFKRAVPGTNAGAGLEVLAPDFSGEWRQGEEVELVFLARGLGDLAGYGFDLTYDPADMEVVGEGARVAELFRENPLGFFRRVERETDRLSVAAARRGREWSAAGEGELLRVRVRLYQDGFPPSLAVRDGKLLSSGYEPTEIRLLNDPTLLAVPRELALRQNYPNPFNPSTTIPFEVPALRAGVVPVSVEIFNALGQRVRMLLDGKMQPGYYRTVWDGRNSAGQPVGSGIYLYRVQAGELAQVRKMTLVK